MFNKIAKVLLACLGAALISASYSEEISPSKRIVGGLIITAADAPYIVRLKHINGEHLCGGTLVTVEHVVTAAHCLDFVDPIRELLVVSGVSTLGENGQIRWIVNYDKPVSYNRTTFHMDYAVLKLNAPMNLDRNTNTIPLSKNILQTGTYVRVSGFGRLVGGGERSYHLRSIRMPIISIEQCYKYFSLTTTMFCTAVQYLGPCLYDSGGPVVSGGQLHGIVSWGRADCDYSTNYPAVFTSINVVYPYIEKAILML